MYSSYKGPVKPVFNSPGSSEFVQFLKSFNIFLSPDLRKSSLIYRSTPTTTRVPLKEFPDVRHIF